MERIWVLSEDLKIILTEILDDDAHFVVAQNVFLKENLERKKLENHSIESGNQKREFPVLVSWDCAIWKRWKKS